MQSRWNVAVRSLATCAALAGGVVTSFADCPCNRGGAGAAMAVTHGPTMAPDAWSGQAMPSQHLPMEGHMMAPGGVVAGMAMTGTWGAVVPPGTLGQTYSIPSFPNAELDHPRTGKVRVYLPMEAEVASRGMKAKWVDNYWLLETKDPLTPGVPHIIAIESNMHGPSNIRYVRLIMGRTVELRF